ncbi:hypothetical protein HMPREF9337_00305 [Cutibacterium acnes HL096PA3]|nr:hypothetical protein HMPREF9593_02141 [Cutibacterium acnes HL046PA2]EFT31076.1 hypothetical protein HMPREF9595_01432 [Cutibacterium acnes HL005PA2]EFT54876.1 hypothetical protein HMPREF9610_02119 [Cutibacterium acnes HL027PA2]EFT58711.1 hypothetical protein HMPREF9615_01036 [Cutibacterium acnes HL002PA3]EGE75515.1 hypothetical protein HMPREF9337_00305 [Cutibacterium acnes HL096PA3]EGE91392.1 hypothetical protein HMPREF9568_01606 [Cutibacterium acnes HL013PA2]
MGEVVIHDGEVSPHGAEGNRAEASTRDKVTTSMPTPTGKQRQPTKPPQSIS